MELEMNSQVEVTLTAEGAEILNAEHKKFREKNPNATIYGFRTDYKEGDKHHDMLWEIMALFGGSRCYNGASVSFTSLKPYVPEEVEHPTEIKDEAN